jgi:AcrR family transcriptional regulator
MSPRSKELSARMKARSRKAITLAALDLFASNGFSATTTDAIARKARVSKGLIFSHFPTKEDILLSIIDQEIERITASVIDNSAHPSPREKLVATINSWMGLLDTYPQFVHLSLKLNLDEGWRKIIRKKGKAYLDTYLGSLRDLFVQLGSPNPDLDCYLLAVFFDGLAANYLVAPKLFPLEDLKNHLIEMLLSRTGSA